MTYKTLNAIAENIGVTPEIKPITKAMNLTLADETEEVSLVGTSAVGQMNIVETFLICPFSL